MKLTFTIERWDAWIQGIRSQSEWLDFFASGKQQRSGTPFADLQYHHLKPVQRRRLSDISKITLDVAFAVAAQCQTVRSVFASRWGEVSRMADLLTAICTGEDLSPTAFSMSVHNTSSGLFSIQSGNRAPSTAIAAGHDTVIAGWIEACTLLSLGQPKVLLVISEDLMPDVYQQFSAPEEQPVAAAFLLTPGDEFRFELSSQHNRKNFSGTCDQVIQILRTILTGKPAAIAGERMQCQIHQVR